MIKLNPIFLLLILFLIGCSSYQIDLEKSNKRSYDLINKEKLSLASLNIKTFDTDTTINFKTIQEIIDIFGKPNKSNEVTYTYPQPNILWILEGPLDGIKKINILKFEWEYKDKELHRVVIFIKHLGEYMSFCNILYEDGLEY